MPDSLIGFVTVASACAYLSKICVDLARMAFEPLPRWVPPLLAGILGIIFALLLQIAAGATLTGPLVAQCVIVGIMGAGAAVGSTELNRRADKPGGNA